MPATGGKVRGALSGRSRNESTTCTRQKGTGGPEALYLLHLRDRALVELEVSSDIDTVLAVRRVCDDPLTELACNDAPIVSPAFAQGSPVDAGSAPPPAAKRDAHLRAVLDAGSYFVIVDEAEPFGVGGPFDLSLTIATLPAQSRCSSALPVTDGTRLAAEDLDLASEPAPLCELDRGRPALYYTATVPSGQRISVLPTPTRGDEFWFPVVQVFSACGQQPVCLAMEQVDIAGTRVLRHLNSGPSEQKVMLSVAPDRPVHGANFRLDVNIGAPLQNITCDRARPLSDGLVLRGQDLSEGKTHGNSQCQRPYSPSLFYSATLIEQETVKVTLSAPANPSTPLRGLFVLQHDSCGSSPCLRLPSEGFSYTNPGRDPKTILIEVSSVGGPPLVFDMSASMTLPPPGVDVTPTTGLSTSEAGGQAAFDVVLTSVPREPVVIPLASDAPREGTVAPASLRFEASNWRNPQRVTVTGVDDTIRDGSRSYSVHLGPAVSADPRYSGFDPPDVLVVNHDDEPGFTVERPPPRTTPLTTSESGGTARFTVALNRAPTATVRLPIVVSDDSEARVSPAELVFEPSGWNTHQTVIVTGVDDADRDGTQGYEVLLRPAVSDDPQYSGLDPEDLPGRNSDDDFARVAAQPVKGKLDCLMTAPYGQPLAADDDGNLYVVLICLTPHPPLSTPDPASAPKVFVAVSNDGGSSWNPPVDTGLRDNRASIIGVQGGTAVLAGRMPEGNVVTRTANGGASWQTPQLLSSTDHAIGLQLAASGGTVAVGVPTGRPFEAMALWVSMDAGRSFQHAGPLPGKGIRAGLAVDAAGNTIWSARFADALFVHKSSDGGASFDAGTRMPGDFYNRGVVAFGGKVLYAVDDLSPLLAVPLQQLAMPRVVEGYDSEWFVRAMAADAADNLMILQITADDTVQARLLPAGASSFLAPRPLGKTQDLPSAVALSPRAVAVAFWSNQQLLVGVETWP